MPVVLLATGLACSREAPREVMPPPLVRAYAVTAAARAPLVLRGVVGAAQRVHLGFKQGGLIAALLVDEGDRVARGQVVGRLDDLQARSLVRVAQAARDKAERDAARTLRLAAQGAVPASVRDDATSLLEAADAQLAQAKDVLEQSQLRAPVAGTVFKRLAEAGETVGSGNPVLIIDSSHEWVVRAGVNERQRGLIRAGMAAALAAQDGRTTPGRVFSLATTPNVEDGLFTVEVKPEGAREAAWLSGTLLTVSLETASSAGHARIPLDALVHRRDRDLVFLIEKTERGFIARARPIVADHVEGAEISVREGLKGGERIIAEGAYFIQDGQAVRVME
ncbi:MAG: efflux RND transporter periplasmic adaptor subunit [Vicinamibacteria bacterium]|nr:efflux RND transporter periplasmic adaptor subunit [Vicinamibacteria bacterium]